MADDPDSSYTEIGENANKSPCKGPKRKQKQIQRHSQKPCVRAQCRHPRNSPFQCSTIPTRDLEQFNASFYSHPSKIDQDNWIAKFIKVKQKKMIRRRPNDGVQAQRQRNTCETSFFMRTQSNPFARVCKDFFLKALAVGRCRVEGVAKHFMTTGLLRAETRGGDRKLIKYGDKRTAVSNFLQQLKGRESHYGRNKTTKLYLPPSITSVKQLWNMFSQSAPQSVKYEFFRRVFKNKFRIGFGSPKTDACSLCERIRNQIKAEIDPQKKQSLMTELRIHKTRANVFYKLISEKREGLKILCFDHQQNQVLPKVPDQIAYYSRQLYMYNFTIVDCREDGALTHDNVHIYTWKENEFAKNSSACASAVFHALKKTDMTGVECVRLVSDACGGQNKNSTFLYMAGHWLSKHAPRNLKRIEMAFPVRGHSFLPCDRVFGVLEKQLRLKERIYSPEEYIEIYKKQGTVHVAGEDWDVLDFKEVSDRTLKKPLPIKIQDNKRFFIAKGKAVTVQAEPNYCNMINQPHIITKKGMSFLKNPVYVEKGVGISEAKKADMKKLMIEHAGEGWETDQRFAFVASVVSGRINANPEEEEGCSCLGEDPHADTIDFNGFPPFFYFR